MSRERFLTVATTGWCPTCDWSAEGSGGSRRDRAVVRASRRHAKQTGHEVHLERTSLLILGAREDGGDDAH